MEILKKMCIVAMAVLSLGSTASAQSDTSGSVYEQVTAIVERYQGEKGIKAFIALDGFKLQTVKMMLRKEFGKEFVDNIKTFAILFYKEAERNLSEKIVADTERVATTLHNIDISKQLRPGAKGEGYIRLSQNEQRLTDLLIIMKSPSPRLIYFGGEFKPESVQYKYK